MKILIAEDDSISRQMLERILHSWNYDVIAMQNGKKAWEVLQQENAPKLVMVDWMMPEMDGLEVCRKLRAIETNNPAYIILLTAMSRKTDIVNALDSGANDFISKPFNKDELRARLAVGVRMLDLQQKLLVKITELQQASEHIQTLQGILPICMHCHKIRTDDEAWEQVDMYIAKHSEAQFSHSLCPDCLDKFYPEEDNT